MKNREMHIALRNSGYRFYWREAWRLCLRQAFRVWLFKRFFSPRGGENKNIAYGKRATSER